MLYQYAISSVQKSTFRSKENMAAVLFKSLLRDVSRLCSNLHSKDDVREYGAQVLLPSLFNFHHHHPPTHTHTGDGLKATWYSYRMNTYIKKAGRNTAKIKIVSCHFLSPLFSQCSERRLHYLL